MGFPVTGRSMFLAFQGSRAPSSQASLRAFWRRLRRRNARLHVKLKNLPDVVAIPLSRSDGAADLTALQLDESRGGSAGGAQFPGSPAAMVHADATIFETQLHVDSHSKESRVGQD